MLCEKCKNIPFELFAPCYSRLSPNATRDEWPTPSCEGFSQYSHHSPAVLQTSAEYCQLCKIFLNEIKSSSVDIDSDLTFFLIRQPTAEELFAWQAIFLSQIDCARTEKLPSQGSRIEIQYNVVGKSNKTWDKVYQDDNLIWVTKFRTPNSMRYLSVHDKSKFKIELVSAWINTCLEEHPACFQNAFSRHLAKAGLTNNPKSSPFVKFIQNARKDILGSGKTQEDTNRGMKYYNGSVLLGEDDEAFRPTRLLDVGKGGKAGTVKLCTKFEADSRYIALSHCWGKHQILTTTKETLDQRYIDIPMNLLPRTFRDAVQFTRQLGLRYLWIDSLCIIQDDAADWERESKSMWSVYGYALCTIAASNSLDSTQGLRGPVSDETSKPCWLEWPDDPTLANLLGVIIIPDEGQDTSAIQKPIDDSWLATRAWTLQERALSIRIVHFTSGGLVWECRSHLGTELLPEKWDHTIPREALIQPMTWGDPDDFHSMASSNALRTDLHKMWKRMMTDYSNRNITKYSDRLPALSGLATKFEQWLGDEYVAGMWRNDLLNDLLWHVDEYRAHTRAPKIKVIKGPLDGDLPGNIKSEILEDHQEGQYLVPKIISGDSAISSKSGTQERSKLMEASRRVKAAEAASTAQAFQGLITNQRKYLFQRSIIKRASLIANAKILKHVRNIEEIYKEMGLNEEEVAKKLLESGYKRIKLKIESQEGKEDVDDSRIYVAPTWSWISHHGAVAWNNMESYNLVSKRNTIESEKKLQIIDIKLNVGGTDLKGYLTGGSHIITKGRMRRVIFKEFDPDGSAFDHPYFWLDGMALNDLYESIDQEDNDVDAGDNSIVEEDRQEYQGINKDKEDNSKRTNSSNNPAINGGGDSATDHKSEVCDRTAEVQQQADRPESVPSTSTQDNTHESNETESEVDLDRLSLTPIETPPDDIDGYPMVRISIKGGRPTLDRRSPLVAPSQLHVEAGYSKSIFACMSPNIVRGYGAFSVHLDSPRYLRGSNLELLKRNGIWLLEVYATLNGDSHCLALRTINEKVGLSSGDILYERIGIAMKPSFRGAVDWFAGTARCKVTII